MDRRHFLLGLAAAALWSADAQAARRKGGGKPSRSARRKGRGSTATATAANPSTPDGAARRLYADLSSIAAAEAPADIMSLSQRYFTPELDALLRVAQDRAASRNDAGLTFDPFLGTEELRPFSDLAVLPGEAGDEAASVDVAFVSAGENHSLRLTMGRAGKAWRIDNVVYGDGRDLRTVLASMAD